MKTYCLLLLRNNANTAIAEIEATSKAAAVQHFQLAKPELKLNEAGYAKHGNTSYCVAEQFDPQQSNQRA
jgi:hypothetical protein